jgi:hypothetical protein
MKKLFAVAVLVAAVVRLIVQSTSVDPKVESGLTGVNNGEIISGWLENLDTVSHTYEIVIHEDSSGFVSTVLDTGTLTIAPGAIATATFTNTTGINLFNVEITTSSNKVFPTVIVQVPGCSPDCMPPRLELHGKQLTVF